MSDAKKEAGAEDAPKAKGGKKKLIVIGLAAVLALGGGGAAWFFLGRGEHDEAAAEAKAAEKRKASTGFVTLENFVVNLADTESDRFVQVGVVLEVEGKDAQQKVSDRMPALRNQILLLISSKVAKDLTSREGKETLANEIALVSGQQLGWTTPDEQGDDGDDEPPPAKSKDVKAKAKPAKAPKPKPPPAPNPVVQVHFASFIVQ